MRTWCLNAFDSLLKVAELSKRINDAETAVKRIVADYEDDDDDEFSAAHNNQDIEVAVRSDVISAADDAGSDDDDDDDETASLHGLEEEFRRLEEEVATLVADVHDLALYTKVGGASAVNAISQGFSLAQLYWIYENCQGTYIRFCPDIVN